MNSPPLAEHHGGQGPNCQDKCILKRIEFRDKAARAYDGLLKLHPKINTAVRQRTLRSIEPFATLSGRLP